jgi:spermidine synthase
LLGNSVTQFSLSIGLFVGSMGIGSWLSQRIRKSLVTWFIGLEVLLGLLGGVSATALFGAYAAGPYYWIALFSFLIGVGTLVGIELPLLVRLLDKYGQLRTIVAQALSFDYLGSLVGSLLFPLVLLPALGVSRTAYQVGLVNVGVAVYTLSVFRGRFRGFALASLCGVAAVVLAIGFVNASRLHALLEHNLYDDEILYAKQSQYQRIVITRWREDLRLYLDGNLQFSSVDEYRYHESLVHPPMAAAANRHEVLILGGGDGLGVREVLRWPEVRRVTLVDLDPAMTGLGRTYPALVRQNAGALNDPRVTLVHTDAHRFLETSAERYGVIIADLPDPNGDALAKLYSVEFYRLARRRLARGGVFVTQATSPYFSREAYWCVVRSMRRAGFKVHPYHAYVPSFGDWGFAIGAEREFSLSGLTQPPGLRYLNPGLMRVIPVFDADTGEVETEVSDLDHPRILHYYLEGNKRWD